MGVAFFALVVWRVARTSGPQGAPARNPAKSPAAQSSETATPSARRGASTRAHRSTRAPSDLAPGVYQVLRVIDGDTLTLRGVERRVRLQGVDAPEIVTFPLNVRDPDAAPYATRATAQTPEPWGSEAAEFVRTFVRRAGGNLRLEVDGERTDHYGRFLAFAWHEQEQLNEALVRAGLARALLDFPYGERHKLRLAAAQREARSHARGIWSRKGQRRESKSP